MAAPVRELQLDNRGLAERQFGLRGGHLTTAADASSLRSRKMSITGSGDWVLDFDQEAYRQRREDFLYRKVLLAYDGSIEGRRALREGARIAQLCGAQVFLLAVVEVSAGTGTLEGGLAIPISEQAEIYNNVLAEGVERLEAMGFSPTARLGMGEAGREIAAVAKEIGANLVVVGHRADGPLARWWFSSVGTYLVKHVRCSVLVAQTEIGDEEFSRLLTGSAVEA